MYSANLDELVQAWVPAAKVVNGQLAANLLSPAREK